MKEILILGGLTILFNILDSVTTEWTLDRGRGDGLKTQESNPLARDGLMHHPILFHAMKQGAMLFVVVGMVVYGAIGQIAQSDMINKMVVWTLAFLASLFGLVVLNNTYIDVMKIITGKRWYSPYTTLVNKLGLKNDWVFPLAMSCNAVVSAVIAWMLVRI